jgi:hypothetical protein
VALIPESEAGLDAVLRELELAALGAASVRVGTDVARACQAARELLDDSTKLARAAEDARMALVARQDSLDWGMAALAVLESVHSAPARQRPPPLPASIGGLASGLRWSWYRRGSMPQAFPPPASKTRRRWAKLRRDPGAFFRDAKLAPLRLLAELFD